MATYTPASKSTPSLERAVHITDVEVGDRLDFNDILGRPANKLVFHVGDSDDIVEYKINHKRTMRTNRDRAQYLTQVDKIHGVFETSTIETWLQNTDAFTATGALALETVDDLKISSLEITDLTLASGTTIIIDCF